MCSAKHTHNIIHNTRSRELLSKFNSEHASGLPLQMPLLILEVHIYLNNIHYIKLFLDCSNACRWTESVFASGYVGCSHLNNGIIKRCIHLHKFRFGLTRLSMAEVLKLIIIPFIVDLMRRNTKGKYFRHGLFGIVLEIYWSLAISIFIKFEMFLNLIVIKTSNLKFMKRPEAWTNFFLFLPLFLFFNDWKTCEERWNAWLFCKCNGKLHQIKV